MSLRTERKIKVKTLFGIGTLVLVVVAVAIAALASSCHTVDEGKIGIYFVNGALTNKTTQPGVHFSLPFLSRVEQITIRPKTDTLNKVTTVTKDGIENEFVGIQVISDVDETILIQLVRKFGIDFRSALIYDRVKEELRIFCANHTIDEVYNTMFLEIVAIVTTNVEKSIIRLGLNGIKILNLVVPKPNIPPELAKNYKEVKVQWTEQLVAIQQQKTEKIKKETETMKAVQDANRQKEVMEIDNQRETIKAVHEANRNKEVMEIEIQKETNKALQEASRHKEVMEIHIQKDLLAKEGQTKLSEMDNEIVKLRERNVADVDNYKKTKEAEANQNLYTPDYVKLELAKNLASNTKFFFSGDQSPLGAVLAKIMGQA